MHYMWINYYSQIVDSTTHEAFSLIQLIRWIHPISKPKYKKNRDCLSFIMLLTSDGNMLLYTSDNFRNIYLWQPPRSLTDVAYKNVR